MRKTAATFMLAGAVLAGAMVGTGTGRVAAVHAAAPSGTAIVHTALQYLHYPYRGIGHTPATGFSDVGFVGYVLRQDGIQAPDSRGKLLKLGTPVAMSDLQPGDILFFKNTVWYGLSHVAIYAGNGTFVHSEWYGYGVTVTSFTNDRRDGNYWTQHFLAARRLTTTG